MQQRINRLIRKVNNHKEKKIVEIIDLLLEKTNEGSITWDTTVWDNVIQTSFTNSSVQIEYLKETGEYNFKVFDNTGRIVDEVSDKVLQPYDPEINRKMKEIFEKAQEMSVERILEDIKEDLLQQNTEWWKNE